MNLFIQNHPGERDIRPKATVGQNSQGILFFTMVFLVAIPMAIAIGVLKRLTAIGKIEGWMMYVILMLLGLACLATLMAVMRKTMYEKVTEQILKASGYAHALFENPGDFYDNYRLGHAYWSNNFKQTNEVASMQKAYADACNWPVKEVPWTQKDSSILSGVIKNSCKDYVQEASAKSARNPIGFQQGGNSEKDG